MLDSDAANVLFRPIVFEHPDRMVAPASWIGHIPFAFWIVEVLRPNIFVELGTQSGVSYSAFAQAVQRLKLPTQCYAVDTWRGDEHASFYSEDVFEDYSRYHDTRFASFSRLVRSTFDEALAHFDEQTIDLLHIDGLHTFKAVAHDFESWLPKLSARGIVLFHDINVREHGFGVWKLWAELCKRYPHFAFKHSHGLGVLGVGETVAAELRWLFGLSEGAVNVETATFVRVFFERLGSSLVERAELGQSAVRFASIQRERDELMRQSEHRTAELHTVRTDFVTIQRERDELARHFATIQHERDELARRAAELRAVRTDLDRCLTELRAASTERDALLNSTSWHVTKPLRLIKRWLLPK